MARPSLKFDLTGQAFKRDPMPTFARMRAAGAVVPTRIPIIGPIAYVTTHAAVVDLLKDADRFAVDARNAGRKTMFGLKWWMPRHIRLLANNMLTMDDPDHRRLRRLVDKAFSRRSVDAYRDRIGEIADELLDELAASSDRDMVSHFARALPLAVICELLGLPAADRPTFIRWMAAMSSVRSVYGFFRMMPALKKLSAYLRDQFAARRRAPRDDLISALVEVEEQGDQLSEDELLAMCFLLFVAGHETTTHLISGGLLALLQNPDQLERLKADWGEAPVAVDELLRYVSPVQITKPRLAKADMEFAGATLRRGDALVALLASANCDPDAFDAPERLDLARAPNRHVAFGGGPHLCLGLQLARAEAAIAFERLFTRFPDLRLGIPEDDLRWTERIGLRALTRLPVALGRSAG